MLSKQLEEFIINNLTEKLNHSISSIKFQSVGGGPINNTYKLTLNNQQNFFLKLNNADRFPNLFVKEKNGLEFLATQHCIQILSVIFCETHDNNQLLILEWIASGPRTGNFWKQFGENLAKLHQCSHLQFGFDEDNYMGSLPQQNSFMNKWVDFFIEKRLTPQMEIALQKNLLSSKHIDSFQKLFKKLDSIFNEERPSLLHGDLWSGNFMCNEQSEPVLIDPAVYFGHRSVDLAMTTLFGGFDRAFYDAYHYHFPLLVNYEEQWEIANLYPLLIHLNLFGQSYLHDINGTLQRFT
ncbi:MAG: fructosamine kinase family protein [Chitinophagaceae bacterium]